MTILSLFEDSDFDYLQFESGDLKLAVSKHGFMPTQAAAPIPDFPATPPSDQVGSAPPTPATAPLADN